MAENVRDNAISLQALAHVERLEFDSIHIANCLQQGFNINTFNQFTCVQAVLKGVQLDEAPLYQPMPDQTLNDKQYCQGKKSICNIISLTQYDYKISD